MATDIPVGSICEILGYDADNIYLEENKDNEEHPLNMSRYDGHKCEIIEAYRKEWKGYKVRLIKHNDPEKIIPAKNLLVHLTPQPISQQLNIQNVIRKLVTTEKAEDIDKDIVFKCECSCKCIFLFWFILSSLFMAVDVAVLIMFVNALQSDKDSINYICASQSTTTEHVTDEGLAYKRRSLNAIALMITGAVFGIIYTMLSCFRVYINYLAKPDRMSDVAGCGMMCAFLFGFIVFVMACLGFTLYNDDSVCEESDIGRVVFCWCVLRVVCGIMDCGYVIGLCCVTDSTLR